MEKIMIEDTYEYTNIEIAKYIITIANNKKIFIDITKLNKLLYIIDRYVYI